MIQDRMKVLRLCMVSLLIFALAACSGASPGVSTTAAPTEAPASSTEEPMPSTGGQETAVEKLTVGIWGGVWGDAYKEAAIDRFTEATGIEVQIVPNAESNLTLLAADVEKSEPLYDVLFVSDTEFHTAANSGMLAPVNYDNITHAEDLYDFGKEEYGISSEIGAWGIAYNENLIDTPPTSWADLLNPEITPLFGFIQPETGGPQIHNLSIFSIAAGGTPEEAGTKGIEVAKQLVQNGAKFGDFGTVGSMFANEEIGVAIFFSQEPIYYRQDGLPARFVLPEEGGYAVGSFMVMPANLPENRKEAAEKLMDFVVSPEAQATIAEKIFSGPINKTVVLDEKLAADIHPYGQEEVDSLIKPDWDFVLENVDEWLSAWEREVVPR